MDLAVIDRNKKVFFMDQISKKTLNPKGRLFLKIDLLRYMAAGVYLFEAHGAPPRYTLHEYIPLYLFTILSLIFYFWVTLPSATHLIICVSPNGGKLKQNRVLVLPVNNVLMC